MAWPEKEFSEPRNHVTVSSSLGIFRKLISCHLFVLSSVGITKLLTPNKVYIYIFFGGGMESSTFCSLPSLDVP